jgi:hypothetical protein
VCKQQSIVLFVVQLIDCFRFTAHPFVDCEKHRRGEDSEEALEGGESVGLNLIFVTSFFSGVSGESLPCVVIQCFLFLLEGGFLFCFELPREEKGA